MQHLITLDDALHHIWLGHRDGGYYLLVDGNETPVALADGVLKIGSETRPVVIVVDGDRVHVHLDGEAHELVLHDPIAFHAAEAGGAAADEVRAPMPGSVIATPVAEGDAVSEGDTLIVIESMKLETAIKAPRDGVVGAVHFAVGQSFDRDVVLATLVPLED